MSLRQWEGLPYRSKNPEVLALQERDGVSIEQLSFDPSLGVFINGKESDLIWEDIARHDGLSLQEFTDWFTKNPKAPGLPKESIAVIHFTHFRYGDK